MELKELKTTWNEMSQQLNKQQELTTKMIMEMTKLKFSNKIKTIATYEVLGAIILFIAAFYILAHIREFDTLLLQITTAITLLIMVGLPVLSLFSIYKMRTIDISSKNQKETLKMFSKRRAFFLWIQRTGIGFALILMFTIIPVFLKITKGQDFFKEGNTNVYWFFPIGFIFLMIFSRWGYRCYQNITKDAENILKELDE